MISLTKKEKLFKVADDGGVDRILPCQRGAEGIKIGLGKPG